MVDWTKGERGSRSDRVCAAGTFRRRARGCPAARRGFSSRGRAPRWGERGLRQRLGPGSVAVPACAAWGLLVTFPPDLSPYLVVRLGVRRVVGFGFFFFVFGLVWGFFCVWFFFFFLDVGMVSFAPGWLGVQVRAVGSPQGSVPFFWGRCACAEVAVAVLLQAGVDRWTLTSSFPSKSHSLVEKTAVL